MCCLPWALLVIFGVLGIASASNEGSCADPGGPSAGVDSAFDTNDEADENSISLLQRNVAMKKQSNIRSAKHAKRAQQVGNRSESCGGCTMCYMASWASPCFDSGGESGCASYQGSQWCGPKAPTGCSKCLAESPSQSCYVKDWSSPCFSPDKAGCASAGGVWCGTPPVVTCTGNAAVDAILAKANLPGVTKMDTSSSVYSWAEFCQGLQDMQSLGLPMYEGLGTGEAKTAEVLVNIASFLAQTMWETGGAAPYTNCDESNYRGTVTAPCSQREDGQLYASLTAPPSCEVSMTMHVCAVTTAPFAINNPPMCCIPGTVTAGCCWWGRGAIQITGPHNYDMLQLEVVDKIPSFDGVNLCTNPEAICEQPVLKWLSGLFYWVTIVQRAGPFCESLAKYVKSFSDEESVVDGASFNAGTGGMVNNGVWDETADGNQGRMHYFHEIIAVLKAAGMTGGTIPLSACPSTAPPAPPAPSAPAQGDCGLCSGADNCFVGSWAEPCFQADSYTDCIGNNGAQWCGGVCGMCSGNDNCAVASWAQPCFQAASESECSSQDPDAQWCG